MSLAEEARQVRQRIAERINELEPLAREYEELQRLAAEMGIERPEPAQERPRRSATPGTRRRRTTKHRPDADRQPPAGELSDRVLKAVRSEPGKTLGEYATILGLSQSALYRPVRELTNDHAIVKRARQLFPE
jgi:hypothetical protein